MTARRGPIAAWVGFTLAGLFLYPLAGALADDAFYLQWQRQDSFEALAALALLWLVYGPLVYLVWPDGKARGRGATAGLMALAALPLASFLAELLQQLPNDGALIRAWENPAIRFGIPGVLLATVAAAFALVPAAFGRLLRVTLLAASPVAVLVLYTLLTSAYYRHPVVARNTPRAATSPSNCGSVVALLFDELSFAYVYANGTVKPEYPAIRAVAASGTQHLQVTAPGQDTLVSLPGYLALGHFSDVKVEAGRLVDLDAGGRIVPFNARQPEALFATARRLGFSSEMAGYYLPYCDLLGDLVDACRSLSFYTVASGDRFSPLDAIATTLVLWPRQLPFGLLKNPPFARLQRHLVDEMVAFARRPLPPSGQPVFRFVHFSIPHLPFVFTAGGFRPPFDPLRTGPDDAYVAQIGYVDRVVGELVSQMKRDGSFDTTTLILFSDHGFRFGGKETDPRHIPFIVKHAGQSAPLEVLEPARAEELLRDELVGACR